MRDIFNDIDINKPTDPMLSARRGGPQPRKRFYQTVGVDEGPDGFVLLLDGKPVRTPARKLLAAPSPALAAALAAEWNAQCETIDPAAMPLTRLANSIIDGVADAMAAVTAEIGHYLGSDLLFYRADAPERLVALQAQHWDPVLDWAREAFGARFILTQTLAHAAQPEPALAAVRAAAPDDPWRLGATHSVMTLTGSALLALAVVHGRLSADEVWTTAHVDEDFQWEQWGCDDEALARRTFRRAEMQAAAAVLAAFA